MLNTLNVQNCVNSKEYCEHQMYILSDYEEKSEYVECTKLCKLNE